MVAVLGEVLARIASTWMHRKSREAEKRFYRKSLTLCDLETMDTNRDGVVEKGEFLAYMLVALQKVSREDVDEILHLFHRLDATKNGLLTKQDLRDRGWDKMFRKSLVASQLEYACTMATRAAMAEGLSFHSSEEEAPGRDL